MTEKREVTALNGVIDNPNISNEAGSGGPSKNVLPLGQGTPHLKHRILKSLYYQFYRIHAILFLFSLGVSVLSQALLIYIPVVQEFAAGFLIFWMPGFCVMFLLWDSAVFKTIYLLPLSLAFSQVVVITEGLLCALVGILWTPLSILVLNSGLIVGSYCVAWKFKHFRLNQALHLKKCGTFEEFCTRFDTGKIIPKNFGYLFIFIILLGIYSVVAFPLLQDDDPWLHARIVRFAMETGIIRFDLYRGVVGLHIYASGFGSLAGWAPLTVAQWFPVFLVINGDLAFYLITRRLFKNAQIANLGTIFVSFTPLLYSVGINNLWPNAIAQPFGLYLLFFLFDALLRKTPTTPTQKWIYVIVGIYFASILRFMHGEIFFNYWLSVLFVLIFYRKNRKSQVANWIILMIALGIFLLVELIYPSYLFLNPVVLLAIPPLLWLLIIPGIFLGIIILKRLSTFPPGNFEIFTTGKAPDGSTFYRFEKKYLKYLILAGLPSAILLFSLIYDYYPVFNLTIASLVAFSSFIELIAAILGCFIMRRQEGRGKLTFFWGLFFLVGLGGYFAYDFLFAKTLLSSRMLVFASAGLILLGMGYVSYFLKNGNLNLKKSRQFITFFAISSLVVCSINMPFAFGSLRSYEISTANALGVGFPENSLILAGAEWGHSLRYFAYEKYIYINDSAVRELFPEEGDLNQAYFYSLRNGNPDRQIFALISSSYLYSTIRQVVGINVGTIEMSQVTRYENVTFFNHVYNYGTADGNWLMVFCLV